jgi:hypothetical protein
MRNNKKDELLVSRENAKSVDKTHPSGLWDNSILCQMCDGKLGKYDAYLKAFLDKDFSAYQLDNTRPTVYRIPGTEYDFNTLKRSLITMLWRASISKLPDFEAVNLGNKYNDLCKKYLKNEIDDIGEIDIIVFKLTTDKGTISFKKGRIEGIRSYRVISRGYDFHYKVGQKSVGEDIQYIRICRERLIIPFSKYEDLSDYQKIERRIIDELNNKKSGT